VAKADLGTKRQCPKCGTRFYDLGKDDPVTCISCEETFVPEVLLKPRRPLPAAEKPAEAESKDEETEDEDSELETGDEDLLEDDDDEDIDGMLEVDDDSIDDEISAEVSIETDIDRLDEK
jgi:uncharacterized protein (TIGR02300 family)